jgi:hypothetical protein
VTEAVRAERLRWLRLSDEVRDALERKLKGLYGAARDEEAFDNLDVNKQQALLLLAHRLREVGLWGAIRRVENVYGRGGVGINFRAWPGLLAELRGRKDFTKLFATHRGNTGGFIERARKSASLHFLYQETDEQRLWAVHFDLHNPWSSPASAVRHLLYEKIRGGTPDWRSIRAALRQEGKLF